MIPIPTSQQNLLQGPKANFSLLFPRLVEWSDAHGKPKTSESEITRLAGIGNKNFDAAHQVLKAIHKRQDALLYSVKKSGGSIFTFKAKLASPFVSGLGSGHPTETGMILDRNTGLPFIPASGIKGVLRLSRALDIAETHPELVRNTDDGETEIPDEELRKFFGDTKTDSESLRGQLVFLDAYPVMAPKLKVDIMNPHFHKYYDGTQHPVDTEPPIPVKFMTVESGTVFRFRCFVNRLLDPKESDGKSREFGQDDEQAICKMFERAFLHLGFGAKTAVGYGRFSLMETLINETVEKYDAVPASTSPNAPAVPPKPAALVNKGQKVEVVVLTEKTKKGAWRAACVLDETIIGVFSPKPPLPQDLKAGEKLIAIAKIIAKDGGSTFEFIERAKQETDQKPDQA
ncbi:MAG TPA: type III-B CRISPR module RAMP protein Cmr6 [Spirochaetota bacterium]|nr:type III-B CRISPR module RAMP protein Cmr6 [Spirochaetota bacterium]